SYFLSSGFNVNFDYRYQPIITGLPTRITGTTTITNPNGTTTTQLDTSIRKSQTLNCMLNRSRLKNTSIALEGSAAPFIVRDLKAKCDQK
ncbi:hypothetical protein, partial [Proteus vulgaris]|uniref:hypothetical protein n=1 Tax=Proteus vulgaris TaxID=585 RepID=UPI0025526551